MTSPELKRLDLEYGKIIAKYTSECPVELGRMASELGVAVKVSNLSPGISGQIRKEDGRYVIRVNRYEARVRQRFTIAHELSHFLLHKHVIDASVNGIQDNVLYRSGAPENIEYQANRLAADIVMPMTQLKETLHGNYDGVVTEETIEGLAELFQVSRAAMEIRLQPWQEHGNGA